MPVTGTVQSALSNAYVVSNSLSNDLIVRSIFPTSRILMVAGCNASNVSCATFSANTIDFNVDLNAKSIIVPTMKNTKLECEDASLSNLYAEVARVNTIDVSVMNASNAIAQDLKSAYAEIRNLSSSIVFGSNAILQQANVQNSFANSFQSSNVTTPSAYIGNVRPLIGRSNILIGTPESTNVAIDTSSSSNPTILSSTGTISTQTISCSNLRAERADVSIVSCTSNICTQISTGTVFDKDTMEARMSFERPGTVSVLSSNFTVSNLYVQQKLSLSSNLVVGEFSLESSRSNRVNISRQQSSFVFDMSESNASIRTSGPELSLGSGNSNSVTFDTNGNIRVSKPMIINTDIATSFGDFALTASTSGALSLTKSNAPNEIARFQVNSTNRGGCISFSNLDAGARVVLWQDPQDINAFGGLGKEPNMVVMRTPPSMGISFVGGNGAIGSEYGRFATSGMLGINTSTPSARIHTRSSNDEVTGIFENSFAPTSVSPLVRFVRNVNVGQTAPPSIEFLVNGSVTGAITHPGGSSTFYGTTSDRRIKHVIKSVDDADDVIARLNPVFFTMKSDPHKSVHAGFVADEVQTVLPMAVTGKPDGDTYMMLDQTRIIPYLVAAIQSLQRKVWST